MELNEFLSELGTLCGLADLRADAEEYCALSVDSLVVQIQGDSPHDLVLIHGEVGELPPERNEAFYRALLEMNYLFAGTRGATLSLKPDSNLLELAIALPRFSSLAMEQILDTLEAFVNSQETIRKFLVNYRSAGDAKEDSSCTPGAAPEPTPGMFV